MSYANFIVLLVLAIVMAMVGIHVFFGSDYAQKKWNPEDK